MHTKFHTHPHPFTFEKAHEAVTTIQTLKPSLSPSELETLELLMNTEAMETIEKSVEEAEAGNVVSLEDAIKE